MTSEQSNRPGISAGENRVLETWVSEFERTWNESRLAELARVLPPEPHLRRPTLLEMVKIDLRRRWQGGIRVPVESYLLRYPELGGRDQPPLDLILAENEARQQHGAPLPLSEYARRFPRCAEELARRLTSSGPAAGEAQAPTSGGPASPTPSPGTRAGDAPEQLPEQFGKFRIVRQLGMGGMGTVYEARDTQLDRRVALKVPRFEGNDEPELLRRFKVEARAAAKLRHPNICTVFECGQVNGVHYLAMEYIEGKPLSEQHATSQPMAPRPAAEIALKLARAMDEAHRRGIIHRDIKPHNVLMDRRGEPIIVDFGLARQFTEQTGDRITRPGTILGTPAYTAPEQLLGDLKAMGPKSDIFSLGVLLYELLTGRTPFEGSSEKLVSQILTKEAPPASTFRPDVDRRLEAICARAIARLPKARYASMSELAAALHEYLANPTPAVPAPAPAPEREVLDALPADSVGKQALSARSRPAASAPLDRPIPQEAENRNWTTNTEAAPVGQRGKLRVLIWIFGGLLIAAAAAGATLLLQR
jgi:serine/threonine protein kinase